MSLVRRAALVITSLSALTACTKSFRFDDAVDGGPNPDTPVLGICGQDSDCRLGSLHCDLSARDCVECLEDAHCADTGLARCDVLSHRCIACIESADCGSGYWCEPYTHRCIKTCTEEYDCPSPEPECDEEEGLCEGCEENSHCEHATTGHICEPRSYMCVECTADAQCGDDRPRCDRVTGTCVACRDCDDCPSSAPFCDPALHTCTAGT